MDENDWKFTQEMTLMLTTPREGDVILKNLEKHLLQIKYGSKEAIQDSKWKFER